MSDDTRRILDLLAQGKITVDEADQLLRAIDAPPPEPEPSADSSGERKRKWRGIFGLGAVQASPTDAPGLRYLKIEVHKPATESRREKHVNIRVPIALVRSGMRLGAIVGGYADDDIKRMLHERGIDLDLSKIDQAQIDDLMKNLGELKVNIDKGRSQVRITCE
jgi:hypothetical protein